jgi:hypothetical protein
VVSVASLFASLALAAAPQRAATQPSVAVVSLRAPADLVFAGRRVAEVVAEAAVRKGGLRVIGPDEVERRLGREKSERLVECGGHARCVGELAPLLAVDRVISGVLTQADQRYAVTLALIDVRTGQALTLITRNVPVSGRQLFREMAAATPALLEGKPDESGTLLISSEVPGAEVFIDDRLAGSTPVTVTVRAGRHQVEVRREGYIEQDPHWIEVLPGRTVQDRVKLYAIPSRDLPSTSKEGSVEVEVEPPRK